MRPRVISARGKMQLWAEALVITVLAYLYFRALSGWRPTDADEGSYLIAGQRLLGGELPHVDFFFPQLPGSPLLYGLGQLVVGRGIESGRIVAVLAAASTVLVMYWALVPRAGRLVAFGACLFFSTHPLVASWIVVAKTTALQVVFGCASIALAANCRGQNARLVSAGVLFGCALACRATAAPLLFALVLAAIKSAPHEGLRPSLRRLSPLLLGCLVPLIPVLVLASMAPARFWFDNVSFHSIYPGGVRDLGAGVRVFFPSFGLSTCTSALGCGATHNVLLLALTGLALARRRDWATCAVPYLVAAATCVAVVFVPVKTYEQYAVPALPFLIVFCGAALPGRMSVMLPVVCLVALPSSYSFLRAYANSNSEQRPGAEDEVARRLDAAAGPGGVVSSRWPNYLVACRRERLPAARSQFARLAGSRVPREMRARHLLHMDVDLYSAVLERRTRAAFASGRYRDPVFLARLQTGGWYVVDRVGSVEVWSPRPP